MAVVAMEKRTLTWSLHFDFCLVHVVRCSRIDAAMENDSTSCRHPKFDANSALEAVNPKLLPNFGRNAAALFSVSCQTFDAMMSFSFKPCAIVTESECHIILGESGEHTPPVRHSEMQMVQVCGPAV